MVVGRTMMRLLSAVASLWFGGGAPSSASESRGRRPSPGLDRNVSRRPAKVIKAKAPRNLTRPNNRSSSSRRRAKNVTKPWKSNRRIDDEEELFEDDFFDPVLANPPRGIPFGVYGWPSYVPAVLNRSSSPFVKGAPIILHWRHVEPQKGVFDFGVATRKLESASRDSLFVFLMIWIAPGAPEWVYQESGCVVTDRSTDPSTSQTDDNRFPDYSNPRFQRSGFRLIDAFAAYVASLPTRLRERVRFVQAAEGSTGDAYGYKGDALMTKNTSSLRPLSRVEYSTSYRFAVWQRFAERFEPLKMPLVFNLNLERPRVGTLEVAWLLDRPRLFDDSFGTKLGMFSHGYHVSNERSRRRTWLSLVGEAFRRRRRGNKKKKNNDKRVFARGEIDKEIALSGWAAKHVPQALYWSALYALHNYLDLWNVPQQLLAAPGAQPALGIFDRYSAGDHHRDASTADRAFVAFRRGLDAADKTSFPESDFGTWSRRNDARYKAIAEAHARFGASLEDSGAVRSAAMMNRRRKGYNDVGWGILRSNFRRHLYQLRADATSTGLWHFPEQGDLHGRFARGLGFEANKNAILLCFHPAFLPEASPLPLTIHLVYFDRGDTLWRLKLRATNDSHAPSNLLLRTVLTVSNEASDTWRRKTIDHLSLFPPTPDALRALAPSRPPSRRSDDDDDDDDGAASLPRWPYLDSHIDALVRQGSLLPDIRIERVRGAPLALHLLEAHKGRHRNNP